MPESEPQSSGPTGAKQRQDARQRTPSTESVSQVTGPEIQESHHSWEALLGSDFSQTTFQRHASLLGDPRLSLPANARQRREIVQQLHRDYGQRYVQRLVDHIARTRAAGGESVTRESGPERLRPGERGAENGQSTGGGTSGNQASSIHGAHQKPQPPQGGQPQSHDPARGVSHNGSHQRTLTPSTHRVVHPAIGRAAAPTTEKEEVESTAPEAEPQAPMSGEGATSPQAVPEPPPGADETPEAPAAETEQQTGAGTETTSPSPAAPAPSSADETPAETAGDEAAYGSPAADTATEAGPGRPSDGSSGSDAPGGGAEGGPGESADAASGTAPGTESAAAAGAPAGAEAASGAADQGSQTGEAQASDKAPETTEGAPEGEGPAPGPGGAVPAGEASPSSPEEDPAFQAVAGRTRSVAAQERAHAPARAATASAQAAAEGPANEVTSLAEAEQVQEMDQQQPQPFDRAAFKAALMQKIAETAPKTLQEADDFKGNNKLAVVKSDLEAKADQGKEQAQAGIEEKAEEQPDTSAIEPKPVEPLEPEKAGPPPPALGAAQAAPKPKSEAEVAAPFQQGSQELDQQMEEAEVTETQLANSRQPEFETALQAKQEAQADAAQAPASFREQEQGVLATAQGDAEAVAQTQSSSMHGDRAQVLAQVVGSQQETKSKDEEERAKVASHIQGIYEKARTEVEARLARLDTEVQDAFDRGAEQARKAFEDYVSERMDAYKEERYSGLIGKGRWVKDKLLGLPPEVNRFYSEGRNLYIARMDAVLDQVVSIVEAGLAEAKAIIAQGRQEIQEYVNGLPKSLQSVGQEAASNIQGQFNDLEQSVDNKQNELIDTLAQKYNESLQQVDARIEELKAANRGLVDKALDAVVGVVRTILQLKDMLLNVLGKAASVIGGIIKDPIGFVGNLVSAVKQGLDNFVGKIGEYLQQGLISWLTGAVASAGIQLPEKLDLKGIFSLVMQILGLTYESIRAMAVKVLGEKVVGVLETTFDIFKTLATEGVAGLWNFIQDKVGDLQALVMDKIKDLLITQVIKAGVKWIIGLLNPAAAFIKACMAIYDIIKFFVTRGREVIELVNAVINSVGAIAKGNLSGAAQMVEQALGRAVPVVIGFLASLLGLGGIGEKVRGIFQTVQKPIKKAIGWVLSQAKKFARKIMGKLGLGKEEAKKLGEPGEDDEESSGVIGKVRKDLAGRLKGPIDSREAIQPIINDVYNKYKGEGLKYLDVAAAPDRAGEFEVIASASPKKKVAKITTSLGLTVGDLDLRPPITQLTAELYAGGQLVEAYEHSSREDKELHAEEQLLYSLESDWDELEGRKNEDIDVSINITRSPCPNCASHLRDFFAQKRRAGWKVQFHVNMMSLYGGAQEWAGSQIALEELSEAGFKLEVWDVIKFLQGSGEIDVIPDETRKTLERRIKNLDDTLKAIDKSKAGGR